MRSTIHTAAVLAILLLAIVPRAEATFSIVACEPDTGRCGVAVATHNLAVGHAVPFAVAGVGAGVSQFETNPAHAKAAVRALSDGETAASALATAMAADEQFMDGLGLEFRQIGIVSGSGNAAAFTGDEAGKYAAHRAEAWVSVQGNGLASEAVLDAMWTAFQDSDGPIDERLMLALEAGYAAGGQTIGVTSAALLVATPEGWPVDIDLRVDFAPGSAVEDLRVAFNATVARRLMLSAERLARDGRMADAAELVSRALDRAPTWDRIWLRAAILAECTGDESRSADYAQRFATLNPRWARAHKTRRTDGSPACLAPRDED